MGGKQMERLRMLGKELYHIWIKQRFLLLFLCLMLGKPLLLTAQDVYIDTDIEKYKDEYMSYMASFEGRLSDSSVRQILADYQEMVQASADYSALYDQYVKGLISSEDYSAGIDKLLPIINQAKIITLAYEACNYASESPGNRYLLYTNGWEAFLANERLDICLLIGIVLFTGVLFSYDYEKGSYEITETARNGRTKRFLYRQVILHLTIFVSGLAFYGIEWIYYGARYGLPDGMAPLQSLISFGDSPYHLSILWASCMIFLLKLLGYLFLAQITACCAVRGRRVLPSAILSGGLVVLPYAFFNGSVHCYFVQPIGLLLGGNYFKGNHEAVLKDSVFISLPFEGISSEHLCIIVCVVFLLSLILFGLSYTKIYYGKGRYQARHLAGVGIFYGFAAICLCGILLGSSHEEEDVFASTYSSGMGFSDEEYGYWIDNGGVLKRVELADAQNIDTIIKNPMREKTVKEFYVDENYIYYVQERELGVNSFYRIEKDTFHERMIYEEQWMNGVFRQSTKYLGLVNVDNYDNTSMSEQANQWMTDFWVDGDFLFTADSDSVDMIDMRNGKKETIIQGQIRTNGIAYSAGTVYYINAYCEVCGYHIAEQRTEKLKIDQCRRIYCNGELIVFENFAHHIGIYSLEEACVTELWEDVTVADTSRIAVTSEYLYCADSQWNLVKISINTHQLERMEPKQLLPQADNLGFLNVCAFEGGDLLCIYVGDWEKQTYQWELIKCL